MILKKNIVYLYTDGSSFSKPRRGGIGIRYIYLDEKENEFRIDCDETGNESGTNNQMELKAVVQGLKKLQSQNISIKYNLIEVRTDSQYITGNINNARYFWSKNQWKNKFGRPIENAILWKELIRQIGKIHCKVDIIWVKGHKNDVDNKAVDKSAKLSAKSILSPPIVPIKARRKKTSQITKRGSIEMEGQRISIFIVTEEYMRIQKLSKYRCEVTSNRSKYYGCLDVIYSELHHLKAGHNYSVRLNKDTHNPRILKMFKELN